MQTMCAVKTNAGTTGWSRRYQAALSQHLKQGSGASLKPALGLGRQAVALGLETLDVVRFHEQALMALTSLGGSAMTRQIERAKRFFSETIVPIEKTHRAALKNDVRVRQLTQALHRRTAESSASTRHLNQSIAQRQAAEATLKNNGKHGAGLLQESKRLQHRLRHQMREILSAQEDERRETSRQLHDEIAQTLLAINLRLLTLKTSAKAKTEGLEKEIAETQRLVGQSVKTMHRLAQEFGVVS